MVAIPVPALTTDQMREVDRLMIHEFHIELIQMMENAGRNLGLLAKHILEDDVANRPIAILAGRGNNGGGGLAAARHLHNWGAWIQVFCSHDPEEYDGVPAKQLSILQEMDVPLSWADEGWELPPCDLVIDAVIGYGLRGDPRGKARDLIQLANSSPAPVLSLDAPSGLDTSEGELFDPHIQASATMTLALPKRGLLGQPALSTCGDLYLADISVPPDLYSRMGFEIEPLFSSATVVPLHVENGRASIADTAVGID